MSHREQATLAYSERKNDRSSAENFGVITLFALSTLLDYISLIENLNFLHPFSLLWYLPNTTITHREREREKSRGESVDKD